MKALVIASALILAGCGGGDKPDIAYLPSDGRPKDSAADLPSTEILNGSSMPPPTMWAVTRFPNITKRLYGKPALSSTGAVAVLGCEDSNLTVNCLVFIGRPGDTVLTALPPFPGKARTINGKTVLLSEKGTVIVNTDLGAAKSNLSGDAFTLVSSAQTTIYGVNAADDFVARDGGTASDFYISNVSSPSSKAIIQKLGNQRPDNAIDINAAGQVIGSLEKPANAAANAYYLATSTSIKGLTGVALQYSETERPLGTVTAMNDSGQITGYFARTDQSFVSKPSAEGIVGGIDVSKGTFNSCCINKMGQLAGSSSFYTGGVVVDLKKLASFQASGLTDLNISDVNEKIQLTGIGTNQGGEQAVVLLSAN
jgi:hypothetical protein